MAGQGGLPDHDQSPLLRLDDHRVELAAVVCDSAANAGVEAERHARQAKPKQALRRKVPQDYFLAALQKSIDLLVRGSTAKVSVLKIFRHERLALSSPRFVIGSGEFQSLLPIAGDRPETRCRALVTGGSDGSSWIFDIRNRTPRSGVSANADGGERLGGIHVWK